LIKSLWNWLMCGSCAFDVLVVLIPTTLALLYRIHVEESALLAHFGGDYAAYSRETKRLIPASTESEQLPSPAYVVLGPSSLSPCLLVPTFTCSLPRICFNRRDGNSPEIDGARKVVGSDPQNP
jgi:hypothetical protein